MENGASVKHQPKFGRVLIKREVRTKSLGGIIIPENAAKRNAPCEGVIVALGETAGFTESYVLDEDGTYKSKIIQTMKEGDRVMFGRHSGAWLNMTDEAKDDGTLFICQDQDILTVIGN